MARGRLAWAVSLPLTATGGFFAHLVAYRLVAPRSEIHHRTLAMPHWRLCVAVCLAALLVALAASLASAIRGRRRPDVPVWFFGLVPPLGFVVQEHLERLLHAGTVPYATALEPVFVVGLLLQLPFAVAAYLLARAVVTLGELVARALGSARRARLVASPTDRACARGADLPRLSALALGHSERGPPALPVST